MNKVKVGDKVRIINKPLWVGAYQDGDTGVVVDRDSYGNACVREDHVLVLLDKGCNQFYTVHENEIQVVNTTSTFNNLKPSAEEVRENILSLRIERERLKASISDIDKQEVEMLELLKEMGFVLHEEVVKTCGKTVLYAEDIEEDMADPLNWKVGDRVKVAANVDSKYCELGDVFEVSGVGLGGWVHVQQDSTGSPNTINPSILKFHSRPVNF